MRRQLLGLCFILSCLLAAGPTLAGSYRLVIEERQVNVIGKPSRTITVNGTIPGPVLRFRAGEQVEIHVTNRMKRPTSVHWHGLILPGDQDGVPGFNGFPGIQPGETFTYRFPIRQAGTYWYHAHSGTQEQAGLYGALIIDPATPPAEKGYDREYVVFLSDFTTEDSDRILKNLKVDPGYYNYARRTLPGLFRDARKFGWQRTLAERGAWRSMNMEPTDIADTGGYTFLVNGRRPDLNETFLFTPGERVKLRIINGSAMSYFDVRIPGLAMKVAATDGADVEPVTVDELRIAVAETYDVIVEPKTAEAFTFFAESIDRSGYARATLAPRAGMSAPVPAPRPRAILTMAEMGHAAGHDGAAADPHAGHASHADHGQHAGHANHAQSAPATPFPKVDHGMGAPMDHAAMDHGPDLGLEGETDGSGHVIGWASGAPHGSRVLSYADLRAAEPAADRRLPTREIVVRLGGNMERYIWTMNGKTFRNAEPVRLRHGERVRLTFINETMMAHPMHLHGMFVRIENGQSMDRLPEKTVVSVAPGRRYSALLTADQPGEWAFHCHLLYHMEAGMMARVVVATLTEGAPAIEHPPADPRHQNHGGHH